MSFEIGKTYQRKDTVGTKFPSLYLVVEKGMKDGVRSLRVRRPWWKPDSVLGKGFWVAESVVDGTEADPNSDPIWRAISGISFDVPGTYIIKL